MQGVVNKIIKVVESCTTPQQLQMAEHFAALAKRRINRDQWVHVACAIQSKAGELLFYDSEDIAILRRAYSSGDSI